VFGSDGGLNGVSTKAVPTCRGWFGMSDNSASACAFGATSISSAPGRCGWITEASRNSCRTLRKREIRCMLVGDQLPGVSRELVNQR
jgi:hypothetical protein